MTGAVPEPRRKERARASVVLFLFALAVCTFILCATGARTVHAQTRDPSLSARVDQDTVEVGEPFNVTLQATTGAGSGAPSDPRLMLPAGLTASSPSTSTQSQVSIVNGRMTQSAGVTVTWQVVASREGKFKLGPLSVMVNGTRVEAQAPQVTVGPRGSHPHRSAPRPGSPFDPFGIFPKFPGFFDNPQPDESQRAPVDPEVALDAPLDQMAFLRATVNKTTAVVGEQVTATVYLYTRRAVELLDLHEPSTKDFLRRDLMAPGAEPDAQPITIAGVSWYVKPLYRAALFPLRSGDLEITPMRVSILGAGRGNGARGGLSRESTPLSVHVTEPPSAGRPNGYQMGDVGKFTISASVDPRKAEVDAAVAVNVTVTGTGNLPSALRPPMQNGVEWLDPETRESWDTVDGKVRGSRTYTFLVRPKTAGNIDLGSFSLPYWNPELHAYEVAHAALGSIRVLPNPTAQSKEPDTTRDPWAAAGPVRTALSVFRPPTLPWTDHRAFWLALLGAPIAVVAGTAGTRGARAAGARLGARKQSAAMAIELAFADGRAAEKQGDARALAAAVDRALYLAIEAKTGLRARAVLLHELPAALEAAGVHPSVAGRICELFATTESIRFGQAPGGSTLGHLLTDARSLYGELARSSGGPTK